MVAHYNTLQSVSLRLLPVVTSPVPVAWLVLPNTTQSLQTNMMANISPRTQLNYDSDTFSLDFNVEEYSPEVEI